MVSLERRSAITVQIPVHLRTATAKDLPLLEWFGQYRHFRNLFRRTYREQQAGRRLMLLAVANHYPVGYIFIQFREDFSRRTDRAYFYSFRVMDMFQRQGIGTLLLQEAEARAAERGVQRATIAVAKENTDTRRLYERLDYVVYDEDDGDWSYVDHRGRICYVSEPCWLLEKYLSIG